MSIRRTFQLKNAVGTDFEVFFDLYFREHIILVLKIKFPDRIRSS